VCATSAAAGRFSHLDDGLFLDEIKMLGITIRPVTPCKAERAAPTVSVAVLRFVQTAYSGILCRYTASASYVR